jgi:hypothetical protein
MNAFGEIKIKIHLLIDIWLDRAHRNNNRKVGLKKTSTE